MQVWLRYFWTVAMFMLVVKNAEADGRRKALVEITASADEEAI